MGSEFVDPLEMEKRKDPELIAIMEMIDEGSPVHYDHDHDGLKKLREVNGFDEKELPRTYQ
ncbi:hypothetical protein [Sporosarcina sp. USHLN248]|uniref:hypothetical protein n=1 Tax=Sporosarcina sp. USHLN248 TaxID=3081300 RepID=UPI003017172F